jgi:UDP-glucuronate decarboxylase
MESNYTQPVNLGNPDEYTIQEFADVINQQVGGQSEIQYLDAVIDDPQRRRPDITRAIKYLNWTPKIKLEEGIQKTIHYFENELKVEYVDGQK